MTARSPAGGAPQQPRSVCQCTDVVREYSRASGLFGTGSTPSVRALDGVSLTLREGEVVGIAGPSGSGKSTLLHLLAGLDTPTAGAVRLLDNPVGNLSGKERTRLRREHIGIVFQRFHLLPSLSARANVALPLIEHGIGKRKRRRRAESLLEQVGLGDRLTHKPGTLSGGEQQRVAVARALACEPALVIADEPTGELDTETGERVLSLLADVADERAVVLASHDQRALDAADRVITLLDGKRQDA